MKFIQRLAWAATIVTYFLIALGGTVLATDSGLSCPDWPFCNGQAYYAGTYHTFLEQFHRFTAATVSILIVLLLSRDYSVGTERSYITNAGNCCSSPASDPDCFGRTYGSLEIAAADYYGASGNRSGHFRHCDHDCCIKW